MKSLKIILILIFSHNLISAQVDYTEKYYKEINNAELQIIKNNFEKAFEFYEKAFKSVPRPFAKDYYNALLCAIETEKFDIAFDLCDSLIRKGVQKEFFIKDEGLNALKIQPDWSGFIENFDIKYEKYNSDKNLKLREELIVLENKDQEFRIKEGSYDVYGDTIAKIDKENIKRFKEIVKAYGFPNENLLGIDNPKDNSFYGYILIHHHCQQFSLKKVNYDFQPTIDEAIKNGLLEPHLGYFLLDQQGNIQIGNWGIIKLKTDSLESKLLAKKFTDAEKLEIDIIRIDKSLENLNDFYLKSVWGIQNKENENFAFNPYTHLSIFMLDKNMYDLFLEKYEQIE